MYSPSIDNIQGLGLLIHICTALPQPRMYLSLSPTIISFLWPWACHWPQCRQLFRVKYCVRDPPAPFLVYSSYRAVWGPACSVEEASTGAVRGALGIDSGGGPLSSRRWPWYSRRRRDSSLSGGCFQLYHGYQGSPETRVGAGGVALTAP